MNLRQINENKEVFETIYIGIDVHKKSWSVSIMSDFAEFKSFTQPPEPEVLASYVKKHFPDARYFSAYESGFSGFWAHRRLEELDINNLVVNPSDIPTTDKEKKQKRDAIDCRKIAKSLRNHSLKGIYVPDQRIDEDKALVRFRQKLVSDIRRCKNRIKSLLLYWGIRIPEELDHSYWSKSFKKWLRDLTFQNDTASLLLTLGLDELQAIEKQKRQLEKHLVHLSTTRYKDINQWLRSIPGIGILGAMTLITEIKDIHRFNCLDQLHSFAGLIPNVSSSGDKEYIGGITQRHNHYLRPILIQCAWRSIKCDPVLFRDYNRLCKKMKASKAIVRIAKKLLHRVNYVWKHECEYESSEEKN
ncbi:MAG: IS110 family transposase [Bacteroidota bacterium]